MSPDPDDLKTLIGQYRTMNIEELKKDIDHLEEKNDFSRLERRLDIEKNELELNKLERQKQIELLTKSLTSSSRLVRWISSARAVLKELTESKQ